MKDNMNIFFLCDSNVAPYMTVVLESIKENNNDVFLSIYIGHVGLRDYEKKYLGDVIPSERGCVYFIELSQDIKEICQKIFSKATLPIKYPIPCQAKLLSAWILPEKVEKCLYLDTDTLVIGNLKELYNMDFEGNLVIACQDAPIECIRTATFFQEERFALTWKAEIMKYLSIYPEHQVFNSGVMMQNLKKIRAVLNFDTFYRAMDEIGGRAMFADQDIFNWVYRNSVKLVDSSKFNLQVSYDAYEQLYPFTSQSMAEGHVCIIHFLTKPWYVWERTTTIYGDIYQCWWKYASKTIFFEDWLKKFNEGVTNRSRKGNFLDVRTILQLEKNSITEIIRKYFIHVNAKKIGVYGAGIYGRLFWEDMPKEYEYVFFDKEVEEINGVWVQKPEQLKTMDLDILIVTPFWIENLQYELQKMTTAKVICYDFLIMSLAR